MKTSKKTFYTISELYHLYMETRSDLKFTSKKHYQYIYMHYIEMEIGEEVVERTQYSFVRKYFLHLHTDRQLGFSTLDAVNAILHPMFQLALRDGMIKSNPTDGVLKEIKRSKHMRRTKRHALTKEQEIAFLRFVKESEEFSYLYPFFLTALGTGC